MLTRDTHRAGEEVAKTPAAMIGNEFMSFKVTLSGAAPHAITFSGQSLPDMYDNLYRVFPHGETASRLTVDESTITEAGFSLLGGADTEVAHILVHGKIAGRDQV
jgi:hypothetical protein